MEGGSTCKILDIFIFSLEISSPLSAHITSEYILVASFSCIYFWLLIVMLNLGTLYWFARNPQTCLSYLSRYSFEFQYPRLTPSLYFRQLFILWKTNSFACVQPCLCLYRAVKLKWFWNDALWKRDAKSEGSCKTAKKAVLMSREGKKWK